MADKSEKAEAKAVERAAVQVAVEGDTAGAIVSIDGNEFELTADEAVALKHALDQAVVGLSL